MGGKVYTVWKCGAGKSWKCCGYLKNLGSNVCNLHCYLIYVWALLSGSFPFPVCRRKEPDNLAWLAPAQTGHLQSGCRTKPCGCVTFIKPGYGKSTQPKLTRSYRTAKKSEFLAKLVLDGGLSNDKFVKNSSNSLCCSTKIYDIGCMASFTHNPAHHHSKHEVIRAITKAMQNKRPICS